jgi:folate-binding protein YgfZ
MGLTALLQSEDLAAAGFEQFQTGEYRGATSAARFGDPRAEFAALRGGCGVYDLGYRAKISLTGADRVRWLNGMVTNNIRDLAARSGVYAFLLNPQGRILGDMYAYNRGDSITVDTDRSQLETILATFDHYIIMDDVEVKDFSDGMTALGISGAKAREVLQAAGIAVPEMQPLQVADATCTCDCDCVQCTVVRSDVAIESYELWLATAEVRKTWNALLSSGASPVGYEALEMARIASGIPRYGVDIRERDLPQETEQMRALNFDKGCYVGQEIVERIRSRGAVHRKFTGFALDGTVPIAAGTKISVSEKEVGEVTSAASLPFATGEKTIALGYIRREFATPGHEVVIGSVKASVVSLPIPEIVPQRQGELEHRSA